jgi:molybdenum cofactor cytidylyltransferase
MEIDAVILAAGYSSRAKAFKMELPIGEKPVLRHVIDAFYPICNRIIVVGGYKIDIIEQILKVYNSKVTLVYNEEYDKGMFSSVKCGVQEVMGHHFFLTPGDYPLITTKLCEQFIDYTGEIVIPRYQERRGHPILLPFSCRDEIMKVEDSSNLKCYLDNKKKKYLNIEDDSILYDIDTKEDYEQIMNMYKKKDKE